METVTLKTRFIVRDADGYQISGNPGVGICPMMGGDGTSTGTGDFGRYCEVASTDTCVTVPAGITVGDLRRETVRSLGVDTNRALPSVTQHLWLTNARDLLIRVDDELTLPDVLPCFGTGGLPMSCIMLSKLAGEVLANVARPLRFFIHSKERGHNTPHVHVDYRHESSASMSILDGSLLEGRLPRRMEKRARKVILDNQRDLLQFWNDHTNGIHRDVNAWLGIMPITSQAHGPISHS